MLTWALPFQIFVSLDMLSTHKATTSSLFKIMERSIYSQYYCFKDLLYERLSHAEFRILDDWLYSLKNTLEKPDYIVYIKTDPKKCLKRIKQRNRDEEKHINLKYLTELHTAHEDFIDLMKCDDEYADIDIITINGDLSIKKIKKEYERVYNELQCRD